MAFSLAFSQAPPDHPFVGEYFPVQLTLIDADHEIHGGIELPLSLELYYEEKDKQVTKGVFEVEGSKSPKITKNGMCTCKLHITKSSMELDNRRFVLKASAKMKNGSKLEVWSEPLRVMRYRLVIEEGGILEHDEAETRKMKDAAAARFTVSFLRFRGRPDRVDARRRHRRAATDTPSTLHTNAGLVQGRGRPREVHIIEHLARGRLRDRRPAPSIFGSRSNVVHNQAG